MRSVLAAVSTTVIPTYLGFRCLRGNWPARVGVGGLLGVSIVMLAGTLGAIAGSALVGALAGSVLLALASFRVRLQLDRGPLAVNYLRHVPKGLVVAMGALLVLSLWRAAPEWDAWAIWSLKAKAIAATDDLNHAVFDQSSDYSYSHTDYPVALPVWQAVAYRIAGRTDLGWPQQFQFAWFWGMGALALVSFAIPRNVIPVVITILFLLSPLVLRFAMSGLADVPMALLLAVGTVLLLSPDRSIQYLGAILLAAAALIKNEGVAAVLIVLVVCVLLKDWIAARAALIPLGAILIWAAWTRSRGIENDVVNAQTIGSITASEAMSRVPQVIWAIVLELRHWIPFLLTCIYAIFRRPPTIRSILLVAMGMAFVVAPYLITPNDLKWHLETSVSRVMLVPMVFLLIASAHLERGLELSGTEDPNSS